MFGRFFSTSVSKTPASTQSKKGAATKVAAPAALYTDFGRVNSTQLKMGIVGMANVGKSSTFNLISKQSVPAENFPFCTIDPNVAVIKVPDARFDNLIDIFKPQSSVPATLQVTDIAGLVRGASEGHGLGNEFLAHIKNVDGIYQVVRAFEDEKILHTEGEMNPTRDLDIILQELLAKDTQIVQKNLKDAEKKAKRSLEAKAEFESLKKADDCLRAKKWLRFEPNLFTATDLQPINRLGLLSTKPLIFLINESRKDYLAKSCKYLPQINEWIEAHGFGGGRTQIIEYSVEHEKAIEAEGAQPPQSEINKIIVSGFQLLDLARFFTVGTDEVRAWTIKTNTKAPQAAGAIHTDFDKGFVSAEVMNYDKFITLAEDERLEKLRKNSAKQGKDYIVQDGDIIHFKCKISR